MTARTLIWDTGNGLLSDLVRSLYLDSEGTLWIGTAGGGLSWWRQDHMTTFTAREGLPDNTISEILEDDKRPALVGEQPWDRLREQTRT